MDDDFFRREYDLGPKKRDNLFLWTVCIILLIGGVLASWLGSYYIFAYPEKPRNYKILLKLHKLDPPKRFEYTSAPPGDFYTPQKIYERYATMPEAELQLENGGLLRDFIRNYQIAKNPVPYLVGQFTIVNLRELKGGADLFPSGVVALAQAAGYPQVLIEYVYTTAPSGVQYVKQTLAPGLPITLERTRELSAIIHVEKLDDGRVLLTVMPITYGTYTLKEGSGGFSLDPPPGLHLEGGVPITKLSTIPPAGKNYAARLAGTPAEGQDANASATPASSGLVRVMPPVPAATPKTPGGSHASPTPTPAVAFVTPPPQPIATPSPAPVARVTPTPALVVMNTPAPTPDTSGQDVTPAPGMSPEPATASPTPLPAVAPDHPDVALQPFIEAQATPGPAAVAAPWKTYRPGQMPRGRLLKISDAAGLADHGLNGEQLYLSGQFVVTASAENHAVLRAKGGVLSTLNPLDHSTSVRVFVEFPAGSQPPTEGTAVSRDEMRPFEIRDVRRERDGTIDVMVREVTTPQ